MPLVAAIFVGIKAAVLAIVVEALLRVARRALKGTLDWLIGAAAFIAIFLFAVPFPAIVLAAALVGFTSGRSPSPAPRLARCVSTTSTRYEPLRSGLAFGSSARSGGRTRPRSHTVATRLLLFETRGGHVRRRLRGARLHGPASRREPRLATAGEMLDALGLAETTPGPLILVTEFVGTLAAYRAGTGAPVATAIAGALVTLWATFAPCFLWIFVGAPWSVSNAEPRLKERLRASPRPLSASSSTSAVWFALHVLFGRVETRSVGPLRVTLPDLGSADLVAILLAAVAAGLLFGLHRGVLVTLGACGRCRSFGIGARA